MEQSEEGLNAEYAGGGRLILVFGFLMEEEMSQGLSCARLAVIQNSSSKIKNHTHSRRFA